MNDYERKQAILINYIQSLVGSDWLVKAEYSTNDNDKLVIVVQEQAGQKIVFYDDIEPMFNYYLINIFGTSIQINKSISLELGRLIGKDIYVDNVYTDDEGNTYNEKWQLMFMQQSNPQAIAYSDIRRVSYSMTMKMVVNKVASSLVVE